MSSIKETFISLYNPVLHRDKQITLILGEFILGQRRLFIYYVFSKYLVWLYIKLFFLIISCYLQRLILVEKPEKQCFVLHGTTLRWTPEWWNTWRLVTPCKHGKRVSSQVLQSDSPEAVEIKLRDQSKCYSKWFTKQAVRFISLNTRNCNLSGL